MNSPNVYVLNKSGHDISDAYRFGDVVYLTEGRISRYATNNLYRSFVSVLENSNKNDYILLTGLTVANVIACSIFALIHGSLNILIHQPKDNTYVERRLNLSNLLDENVSNVIKDIKGAHSND